MTNLYNLALRRPITLLAAVAAVAIGMLVIQSAQAASKWERAVTGQWRLIAALDGAHIASLDENEAQRLVGRVLTIRKEAVKFGDRTCGESDFEAERVSPKIYFPEQFHARPDNLGLPNPVTAVDLSCTTVFLKKPNRLVIFWDGWFFEAARVMP